MSRPRLAVSGAGIAGLASAWLLRHRFAVTLFEAEPRAGGHADTQTVRLSGREIAVDTGFIVYNTLNYPHLTALFDRLAIASRQSDMSFAVSIDDGDFEYGGGDLVQLFAQRRNAIRPRFWSMMRDLLRFYREAPALLDSAGDEPLGDWLDRAGYGAAFVQDHLLPMGAAIWSAPLSAMRDFPLRAFVRFFHNHGLLRLTDRPRWRTVAGGSRRYVARLLADLPDLRLGVSVRALHREETGVTVRTDRGVERFDRSVLACHADQALALLAPATPRERALLGAFRTQENVAVLHTDATLMPRRRAAWSAWNYLATSGGADREVSVTYWMNRLQGLDTPAPLFVSLNPPRPPADGRVLLTRRYRHPLFDRASLRAQALLEEIQGVDRVFFAGAWTGYGFHEDGIASAVAVATRLGVTPPWSVACEAA